MAWRQAIIWTNADPIHWRIYVALGGEELNNWLLQYKEWSVSIVDTDGLVL